MTLSGNARGDCGMKFTKMVIGPNNSWKEQEVVWLQRTDNQAGSGECDRPSIYKGKGKPSHDFLWPGLSRN